MGTPPMLPSGIPSRRAGGLDSGAELLVSGLLPVSGDMFMRLSRHPES
jgi:hypothetical protein